ncbi:DUF4870 domain-containing protein [Lederbergia sp. NSJ-179]|uniref:DUF4870 domain-containing protein n=1 Tax=Lederbergia sp. NSJ-179 TaxID=2931402 RepID=UPI001FD514B6|nr:DUF4870 domain-containing protein [Lederbergia sp. NSJ-179]MCJ7841154.1 DUF4870 domain-containing protein [Lederbergia sp. NSJ-179]
METNMENRVENNNNDRVLAAVIYIISFLTAFIGPLVIWLIKKDESAFIDYHGKEYMNFFISYAVYGIVASILMFVLIGFILAPIVAVAGTVFTIIAAVKAYDGQAYRIPLIFRIIK